MFPLSECFYLLIILFVFIEAKFTHTFYLKFFSSSFVLFVNFSEMSNESNATTISPLVLDCSTDVTQGVTDLLTLCGSGMSGVSIIFAMVLYAHYRHLHSIANHIFVWGVLGIELVAAANYFFCIFTRTEPPTQICRYVGGGDGSNHSTVFPNGTSPTTTGTVVVLWFDKQRCETCGFIDQVYSFVEPCMITLFWFHIFCLVQRIPLCLFQGNLPIATSMMVIAVVGIVSASVAVGSGWLVQENQAWCWVSEQMLWFRIAFCWVWSATSAFAMFIALGPTLWNESLNATQKHLMRRRALLAVAFLFVTFVNVASRALKGNGWAVAQALFEPASGLVNVLAFLYSERMMTLRALGLPPGQEPPYGFTAAMKYVAIKIGDDEQVLLPV